MLNIKRLLSFLLIFILLSSSLQVFAASGWVPVFERDTGYESQSSFFNFESSHGANLAYVEETLLPQVKATHPRIFIADENAITNIRSRIASDNVVAGVAYAKAKSWADTVPSLHTNLEVWTNQMETLALVYLVEKENPDNQQYCANLLNKINGFLTSFLNTYTSLSPDDFEIAYLARTLAIVYDWLYYDLDAGVTDEASRLLPKVAEASLYFAEKVYEQYPHSDYNNHLYIQYYNMIYVGLALKDEGINDTAANDILVDIGEMIQFHGIPAHNQTGGDLSTGVGDGGWGESVHYKVFHTKYFAQAVEAWSAATGLNLWDYLYGLDGDPEYYWHMIVPSNGKWAVIDNTGADETPLGKEQVLYLPLLVARRNSGTAAGMMEYIIKNGLSDFRPSDLNKLYDYE